MTDVLIVPPGAVEAADRKALRDAGVVVVELDDPTACQFVKAGETVSSSDMLWAAMDAIARDFGYGNQGAKQREQLAMNLFSLINEQHKVTRKPPEAGQS